MWLREDPLPVAEWEARCQSNPEAVLASARKARRQLRQLGLTPLPWPLWPLRPFYFSSQLWVSLGKALRAKITDAADHLPGELFRVNWPECRLSPYWDALVRPDLFIGPGSTQLLELNFGNGSLLAQAYVDAIMLSQGSSRGALDGYLDWLAEKFEPGSISLLASAADWEALRVDQSLTFPPVVGQIVEYLEHRLRQRGWSPIRELRESSQAILPLTIGYDLDLDEFSGAHWKGVPLVVPFSSLAWEKSVLPWLWQRQTCPLPDLTLPETRWADHPEVFTNRHRWVLKRAGEGKDTLIGRVTSARRWNRTLETDSKGYIAQIHQLPPRCRLPISPEGETIQWCEVAVEVSPFFLNYQFQGGLVRWAPCDAGQLFSPPDSRVGVGFVV